MASVERGGDGGLCVRYVRVSGSGQSDNYSVADQLRETERSRRPRATQTAVC
jgi:hypothetical protein